MSKTAKILRAFGNDIVLHLHQRSQAATVEPALPLAYALDLLKLDKQSAVSG